ncbi:MAG TPA: 50S ribosomal protein L10 [Spirochaetia bacterium]|nr:50S ribosomal protein L10 [Spirochaetia bacterium]
MAEKTQKINAYKSNAIAVLKGIVENASDLIFTDFRGCTVAQLTEIRSKLRAENASYKVVKNNYMNLALNQLGMPDVQEFLIGPTGIAFIKGDSGPVAKVLVGMAKEAPLQVKGGIIEGQRFEKDGVVALSKLPGRNELIARLMGSMSAPAQNLVYALNGVVTKLVRTLKAVADSKQ